MLFHTHVQQQRLQNEVWRIFCSQGQDARIKRNTAVIEMFDFPHIEGNLNEEKHISQANQLHIPPSYCFSQVSCTKIQDYSLQPNLHSHEGKTKSTVQALHAKGSHCKTRVLFHRTELSLLSVFSVNFFCKSDQSQKYIVYGISVFLEVTTSCQFRSAQQQNTIRTLVSKNSKSYC